MGAIAASDKSKYHLSAAIAAGLVFCGLVVLLVVGSWSIFAVAIVVAIGALVFCKIASESAGWTDLAGRLEKLAHSSTAGDPEFRISQAIAALEQANVMREDRVHSRHSVTRLPTREPLLIRMKHDLEGSLGLLSFPDYDRLCAFDPPAAERLICEIAARLRSMMPADRMFAQVDRAQMAIWFGTALGHDAAESELKAIEYALGNAVRIAERSILPEVKSRLVWVAGEEPEVVVARTLSQLAVDNAAVAASHSDFSETVQLNKRFTLEQDLRHAISRDQLYMVYQPLIDASRHRICGAEALMRWRHHDRSIVMPAEFFPVVEACGLSQEFGLWALNTACRDARQWVAEGLGNIRIAVNVSARQLEHDDLPALINRTLARHSLAPDTIEIELTETAAMIDCDRVAHLFDRLRAMGVKIAIDDFGTGYSSLSTLRKLSFDKIKIDREFVTEVERRRDSQAICQSLIALARGLNIAVLAEGVERVEEYHWLLRHGCTYFQGYYFSRPIAFRDFVALCGDPLTISRKASSGPASLQDKISERFSA